MPWLEELVGRKGKKKKGKGKQLRIHKSPKLRNSRWGSNSEKHK